MGASNTRTMGYQPVDQVDDAGPITASPILAHEQRHARQLRRRTWAIFACAFLSSFIVCLGIGLFMGDGTLFGIRTKQATDGNATVQELSEQQFVADSDCPCLSSSPKVPQYFQTTPELWAGPTPTGLPAFLAQTRTFDHAATYVPNDPLVTSIPIHGMKPGNQSIFELMGLVISVRP